MLSYNSASANFCACTWWLLRKSVKIRFQEVVGAGADFVHDRLVREGGEKGERSYAPCASCPWKTQYRATFKQIGLDSSASGMIVVGNSTGKSFSQLPYSFWVDCGANIVYSYYNVSSSTVGKRFMPVNVTGPLPPKIVVAPICVTGNYKTQYLLTVATNPSDLSPQPTRSLPGEPQTTSSWWYDANTTVLLIAQQVDNYTFSNWDN